MDLSKVCSRTFSFLWLALAFSVANASRLPEKAEEMLHFGKLKLKQKQQSE